MNMAHVHLMVNHLPVIGTLIGLGALAFSVKWGGDSIKKMALALTCVGALGAVPAYFSGEGAEEVVEHQPGISEDLIEEHEESAELAIVLMAICGITGLGGLVLAHKQPQHLQKAVLATLIVGTVAFVSVALTARSGGQISHPELRDSKSQN